MFECSEASPVAQVATSTTHGSVVLHAFSAFVQSCNVSKQYGPPP